MDSARRVGLNPISPEEQQSGDRIVTRPHDCILVKLGSQLGRRRLIHAKSEIASLLWPVAVRVSVGPLNHTGSEGPKAFPEATMSSPVFVSALLLPEGIEGGDENAARVTCAFIEPTKLVRRNIDPQRECFRSVAHAIVRGPVRVDFVW